MKVLKYVLVVFFILGGLGGIFSGSPLSGLFSILLGGVFLPEVSELIQNKVKDWDNKILRYGVYIILFSCIGVFSESSDLNTEKDVVSFNDVNNRVEVNSIKDSLNNVLGAYSLSVCEICSDVSVIESEAIKEADIKFPNYGKEHLDYSEKLRVKRTSEYAEGKGISEEIINSAIAFAYECSEEERQNRISNLKEGKQNKLIKKEKIEECFGNACNLIKEKVKKAMHNPKSFEYIDCKYLGAGENSFTISYSYRGQNKLGVLILEKMKVEVDIEKCELLEVK